MKKTDLIRRIQLTPIIFFSSVDVLRQPIVQQIVEAHEQPRNTNV